MYKIIACQGWCQGLGFGCHWAPAAPGSGQAWPQRSLGGNGTRAQKRLSLQNLKPHTAHLGSRCLVHWKLGSVSLSRLKKTNGTGPKRGLDWTVSWTETSCSKFVGVRKSRHFCGLNHASESYWSLPASADHWGLGLKARLGFWDSCFCLRSTCSLCLVHIKLSVRSYQGLPSPSLTSRSQSVIS